MVDETKWEYDPAEHRLKHCWNEQRADFVRVGSNFIGKCPSTLSKETAEELLAKAAFLPLEAGQAYPDKLWAVHEGVVYEAVPTNPGVSYHGYPWRGRPGHNRLPRAVRAALARQAETAGYLREFEKWVKCYET